MPWSPLGRGRLARPWDVGSARTETDNVTQRLLTQVQDADREVVDAVQRIAAKRGVSMAQGVVSPIIGATRLEHLNDAVAALALKLDPAEHAMLESPYQPRVPFGHAV